MFVVDNDGNRVDDPRMKISPPTCNVFAVPVQSGFTNQTLAPPPVSATPSWNYSWDSQGTMHMWAPQQGSNMQVMPQSPQEGPYIEGSMIDASPASSYCGSPRLAYNV